MEASAARASSTANEESSETKIVKIEGKDESASNGITTKEKNEETKKLMKEETNEEEKDTNHNMEEEERKGDMKVNTKEVKGEIKGEVKGEVKGDVKGDVNGEAEIEPQEEQKDLNEEIKIEPSNTTAKENVKETDNGSNKAKNGNNSNKSKKRTRNQDQNSQQPYTNNAVANALIQNLQSILFDLSTQHNNVSTMPGANTTLPIHPNVFATSTNTSSSNVCTVINSSNSSIRLPNVQQVINNTTKAINDCPPWVHLSHRDAAPQLKIDDTPNVGKRLSVRGGGGSNNSTSISSGNGAGNVTIQTNGVNNNSSGGSSTVTNSAMSSSSTEQDTNLIRGYRMVRASHGISEGTAFFEVIINAPPSGHEIVSSLPPHVRLGEKLQNQLKDKILYEQEQERIRFRKQNGSTKESSSSQNSETNSAPTSSIQPPSSKKQKLSTLLDISSTKQHNEQLRAKIHHKKMQMLGGHVRLGWSMRTGELQAPVGYDRWSYGIRDINSSRIHDSKRHDSWAGGEMASFGPGTSL